MKVVFVSTMLPSGHYSQYLSGGLSSVTDIELIVYCDKNKENLSIRGCGRIKAVWSKSPAYILQILCELRKDAPDVVHVQHEINMYGGVLTAALFPVLVLALRASGYRVIVTVHAAVFLNQIDKEFVALFHRDSLWMRPGFLKAFFLYVYKSISLFSDRIVVHTNLKKDILVSDYGVNPSIVNVIPISIPVRPAKSVIKRNYFFYFGYMVRRKGLGYALQGFKKFIENNPMANHTLVLAGGVIGGQEKAFEEIVSIVADNGLQDKVIIKGFVDEAELETLYREAEAVLIPAKVSMGSSGPLFHAVSYGKCVVASKIGHFLEDIKHLETGILTENDKWSEALQFVVDNPHRVAQIENNVREKASGRTPSIIALQHFNVYQAVSSPAD